MTYEACLKIAQELFVNINQDIQTCINVSPTMVVKRFLELNLSETNECPCATQVLSSQFSVGNALCEKEFGYRFLRLVCVKYVGVN